MFHLHIVDDNPHMLINNGIMKTSLKSLTLLRELYESCSTVNNGITRYTKDRVDILVGTIKGGYSKMDFVKGKPNDHGLF